MTFETGAAACLKLARHQYRKTEPGIEVCGRCEDVRMIPYLPEESPLFSDAEVDEMDARDALYELNRAEAEAFGWESFNEADAHRGRPE